MYNKIIDFLKSQNPDLMIRAPARINLINPLDAVEGDFWMPSAAIRGIDHPLSTFLYVKETEEQCKLKIFKINPDDEIVVGCEEELLKEKWFSNSNFETENKLVYASINRFQQTYRQFRKDFFESHIEIGILPTIPRQSGLGGSASIIISIIYGLAKHFDIYDNHAILDNSEFPLNKDIIAEMATKIEDEDLNITAGYADRYSISRGGLAFCSYVGKLHHKEISHEPLAVYDRIDRTYGVTELPIIICYSGISHDSGSVHGTLREMYLNRVPFILEAYSNMANISWKSRFAIMKKDWNTLGKYFKENTRIMNEVMKRAGFEHGIGLYNNFLIDLIEVHPDVHAVKLTGAGGGGSVFALVNPDKIESLLKEWKLRLKTSFLSKEKSNLMFPSYPNNLKEQLKNVQFYRVELDPEGVKEL